MEETVHEETVEPVDEVSLEDVVIVLAEFKVAGVVRLAQELLA
jgi:hypothetical protein